MSALIECIRDFARLMTRAPLYDCGHADAWSLVAKSEARDMSRALGYVQGYADACRLASDYMTPAWQIAQLLGIASSMFETLLEEHRVTGTTIKDPDKLPTPSSR